MIEGIAKTLVRGKTAMILAVVVAAVLIGTPAAFAAKAVGTPVKQEPRPAPGPEVKAKERWDA